MELQFELSNCFGIGNLNTTISYANANHTALVYAPNGTMKTSLTKTIQCVLAGKEPSDEMYPNRVSSCHITIDGNIITKANTYVFQSDDKDGSAGISTFLANESLKTEYDRLCAELLSQQTLLKKRIKTLAHSSDCESEILNAFKTSDEDTFLDCLAVIKDQIDAGEEKITGLDFKFNDLFDSDGVVRQFVQTNKEDIDAYFGKYQELIGESRIYTRGRNSFGTSQANALVKSISDGRYFTAMHKFVLRGAEEISSTESLESLINTEYDRIFQDPDLKRLFDGIEKKINANAGLRGFKDVLISFPELIPELQDYDELQRKLLRGYLFSCGDYFTNIVSNYLNDKDKIAEIVEKARTQHSQWEQVINMFNSRFFVPFKLELANKADILLNSKVKPELIFSYSDGGDVLQRKEKKELVEHLSTGERRAFYLLQNLFEIEARKRLDQPTLLIFDDVADSFDYKNKYAIIEYLSDLSQESNIYLLILTHNFDFYRTITSRLNVGSNIFFAHKNEVRDVQFKIGLYKPDILAKRFLEKFTERRAFIGCIPFVRNLIEYTKGSDDPGYETLTKCLHFKDNTLVLTFREISDVLHNNIRQINAKNVPFGDELYLNALFEEAELILVDDNEVDIVNKVVLCMAIRLKAETYMKGILTETQLSEINPNHNQTGELVKIMKKYHWADKEKECLILGRVLMLTSENIHLNNFMFEPLVDISILYLKSLYCQCKNELH